MGYLPGTRGLHHPCGLHSPRSPAREERVMAVETAVAMTAALPLAALSGATAFWLALVLASTIWVGVDAGKRDWSSDKFASGPTVWVIGMLFLWIIVLPVYLVKRGRVPL